MPLSLERLIYTSRATEAARSLLGVAEILGEARSRNDQRDITGALALHDGVFLQVVEGPRYAIGGLLESLRRDSRHTDLTVIDRQDIQSRVFARWAMVGPLLGGRASPIVEAAVADGASPAWIVEALRDFAQDAD